MGACSSKYKIENGNSNEKGSNPGAKAEDHSSATVPLEILVAHFTPSTFPMIPIINQRTASLCEESWRFLVNSGSTDEFGNITSGVTLFYNEFYERLGQIDSNGKFESVLAKFGQNKIAAKGAILIRIVKLALSIQHDSKQAHTMLFMLGKSHSKKGIRPWQYSVFTQTLLNTIASRLGIKATNDMMEAWVNLFAFILAAMLPPSIKGSVDEFELQISTSSEFASGTMLSHVSEIEEVKKKMASNVFSTVDENQSDSVATLKDVNMGGAASEK